MKPTWIRRTLVAAGATLALLVVAAVTLVAGFDANRHKAWAIGWMQAEHQRTLAIDGPVALSLFPRLTVKVSGLRLSERGRADEFLAVDEAALAVQTLPLLRRQLAVDGVQVRGVRASYTRDATGPRNIDDLAPGKRSADAPGAAPLRFDIRGVDVQDLRLRLHDAQAHVAGELAVQTLSIGALAPGRPAPVALRANLQLTQPQALKLALDGRMQMALDLDKGSVELSALKLDAQGDAAGLRGLTLVLEGQLAWDGRTVALEGLDLRATLAQQAGTPPVQLALGGRAGGDLQSLDWALAGTLNGHRLDSQGRANLAGAVPRVQAEARFDALDLNTLLAPAVAGPAAAAARAEAGLPFAALRAVDGQFSIAAGALAYRHYRGSDVKASATLDNGRLRVTRLAGRAWGGQVEASGSAEADTQRVALKLAASAVDIEALLKDISGKALLEGRGSVNAELGAQGATLDALRSSLAGTVALRVRDGTIQGVNLAAAMRQVKAAVQLKQDAVLRARTAEKTDFTELTASARVVGGVAASDDLDVKSPFLRIGGAGRFDIGRGRIDYTARATVVASAAGQGADELAALRGLTVPVLLTGPFEAIDWKIRWSEVASAAVESRLRQKLAEELGRKLGVAPAADAAASAPASAKDRLRDKLKGLLR